MNILYLAQRFPYPPDRGDRITTFNHIRILSLKHRIHVASLIETLEELKELDGLKPYTASITVEVQSKWISIWGKIRALVSGRPLTLGHFGNSALSQKIQALILREHINFVIVFSTSMAQYVESLAGIPRLMDYCDLDSRKWESLAHNHRGWKHWIYRREARILLDYEKKIAGLFEYSCMVSEREADIFRTWIPNISVSVIPNGVDLKYYEMCPPQPEPGPRISFVGVMDYEPNVEASIFFVQQIWKPFRIHFPNAKLYLVGSRPTAQVLALGAVRGVTVTGFVKDVRPYLAASTLVIVPLIVARGVQTKILEAMAAGIPVLTTPEAAAGVPSESQETLFISERNPDIFLKKLIDTINDATALKLKAQAAQNFVRKNCSWEHTGSVFERLLTAQSPKPTTTLT